MKRNDHILLLTLVTLFILACGATTNVITDPRPWRETWQYVPTYANVVVVTPTATPTPTIVTAPHVWDATDDGKAQRWEMP